jgi:hypothetical protein
MKFGNFPIIEGSSSSVENRLPTRGEPVLQLGRTSSPAGENQAFIMRQLFLAGLERASSRGGHSLPHWNGPPLGVSEALTRNLWRVGLCREQCSRISDPLNRIDCIAVWARCRKSYGKNPRSALVAALSGPSHRLRWTRAQDGRPLPRCSAKLR